MSAFATLWYLDLRRLRTAIRGIVRNPARLLLWIFIGLYLVLQIYTRTRLTRYSSAITFDLGEPYASAFAGFLIALFGATLATSTSLGRSVVFAQPVDALFFSRSALNEHVVILWLQLRQLAIGAPRLLFSASLIVVIFARHGVVGPALGLTGIFLVLSVTVLPASMLSRRIPGLKSVWYAVAVCGLLILAGAIVPLVVTLPSLATAVEVLGSGRFLIALWHGNTIALGTLYGTVVATLAATTVWGRDIYPELYASTRMTEAARAQIRSGNIFAMPASTKPTHSGATYLRGPWVEIWKQAAFLRRANGAGLIAGGTAGALLLGAVAGLLAHKSADLPFFTLLPFLFLVLVIQTTRSVSLAQDIAKPIWWMGDGSTFGKLAAWTLGSTLPLIAFATLVTIAAFALASPRLIPTAVLLVCSTIAASRAIGVLGYALTPSLVDQRGPGMVIRVLMFYAACFPPSVLGILTGIFLHSVQAALVLTSVAFVAEGAASVALATVRFNRGALEVALAEAS
jgi:hypothetical protein